MNVTKYKARIHNAVKETLVALRHDYTMMNARELPPERKLEVLKEMGFLTFWEEHQPDCPSQWDRGIRCNCIPPGTSWRAPRDVIEHLHETYAELKERKRR